MYCCVWAAWCLLWVWRLRLALVRVCLCCVLDVLVCLGGILVVLVWADWWLDVVVLLYGSCELLGSWLMVVISV